MARKIVVYALKVWLTSVLLSPALFWIVINTGPPDFGDFFPIMGYSIICGLVLSFICFLLLWGGVALVCSLPCRVFYQRLITAIWASILTILPFYLLFRQNDEMGNIIKMCASYLLFILGGVFYYRFPRKDESADQI